MFGCGCQKERQTVINRVCKERIKQRASLNDSFLWREFNARETSERLFKRTVPSEKEKRRAPIERNVPFAY